MFCIMKNKQHRTKLWIVCFMTFHLNGDAVTQWRSDAVRFHPHATLYNIITVPHQKVHPTSFVSSHAKQTEFHLELN